MADDDFEGPRRKTYTPPEDHEPFTGSLPIIGETGAPVPPVSPPANPLSTLAPPVRRSLPDTEIMARFQAENAGSTAEMMDELERQVNLREEEEEAFEMWANLTRATRGSDAEAIIERERIIFDGGDPGPLPTPEPDPAGEADVEFDSPAVDDDEVNAGEPDVELDVTSTVEEAVDADVSEIAAGEDHGDSEGVNESDEDQWPLVQTDSPLPEASESEADFVETVAIETGEADSQPASGPQEVLETKDVVDTPAVTHSGRSPLWAVSSWLVAIVPALGVLAGSYFVVRGLGVAETAVALATGGLLAGLLIAVIASVTSRLGVATIAATASTFGSKGNFVPGSLLTLLRWAVVSTLIVWAAGLAIRVLEISGLWPFGALAATITATAVSAVLVISLALVGGIVLTVALWVGAAIGLIGVGLLIAASAPSLSVGQNIATWSADWLSVFAAGSLVLATLVLLFAPAAGEWVQARPGTSLRSIKWIAGFVSVVPTVLLGSYVAWVSVSNPGWLPQLASDPVLILAQQGPVWYPAPAIIVLAVPLLMIAAAVLKSSGVNLAGLTRISHHRVATGVGALVVALALVAHTVFNHSIVGYFPHILYTLGVVVVAWAALVVVDVVGANNSRLQAAPPNWRFAPLAGFVISLALGFGLLTSRVEWLQWQGYLFPVLESAGLIDLSAAQPGVVVAGVVAASVAAVTRFVRHKKSSEVIDA